MKIFGGGLATFTHWFAWTLSLVASVFFLFFEIGDIPELLKGDGKEVYFFLPSLVLAVAGCFTSFFKIKTGSILMLIGGIAMALYFYLSSGLREFGLMVVYGLPYILAGFLLWVVKD